ncbi:hypothetical protein VTK73DRAFT_3112 [Phialemonium thermophilum]|uniref:Uncharacterized protein n=1 Tax=Phialemonium thermophilum TaxID=223376 RepID=A0ABR3VL47_9PEZI
MSFLTEATVRRLAGSQLPRALGTTAPRASFSVSVQHQKSAKDTVKDSLKTVDRVVSDKLVDGINVGATVANKIKEAGSEVKKGQATGKAAELKDETKGKASELAGEAKGKASELTGQAKGKAEEVAGKARGAAEEAKQKL